MIVGVDHENAESMFIIPRKGEKGNIMNNLSQDFYVTFLGYQPVTLSTSAYDKVVKAWDIEQPDTTACDIATANLFFNLGRLAGIAEERRRRKEALPGE